MQKNTDPICAIGKVCGQPQKLRHKSERNYRPAASEGIYYARQKATNDGEDVLGCGHVFRNMFEPQSETAQ